MAAFDSKTNVQRKERGPSAPVQLKPTSGGATQLKANHYVQQRAEVSPGGEHGYGVQRKEVAPESVQMRGEGGMTGEDVQSAAAQGVSGSGSQLPHLDAIQSSFGSHDVSGVDSHVGGAAAEAGQSMGAEAYATGNSVAFNNAPDLHTAAHEAAHVVQQRAGVQLKGGVGEEGDVYETNADQVADRVVAGQSAEDLLPGGSAGRGGAGVQHRKAPVQMLGNRLDEEATGDAKPNENLPYSHQDRRSGEWTDTTLSGQTEEYDYKTGKNKTTQRKYTFGQYQQMWEKDKGRKMSGNEISTLERGCIGITVLNLFGSGNPPLGEAFSTLEQGKKRMHDVQKMIDEHGSMTSSEAKQAGLRVNFTGTLSDYKSVLFAKLFWSNQKKAPNQADFNAGEQKFDDKFMWKKEPLMLPNGMTVDQMMKEKGRTETSNYIQNELGATEYERLTKENHDSNVSAYYLAWARSMQKGDKEAFPIDGETGHVDMTGYLYQSQPKVEKNDKGDDEYAGGYVNFDYGFYDESTDTIWHANHMQYGKGDEKREKQPMYVYQSTPDKFTKGYTDFDRVIFCVGLQKGYDPNAAANAH
jgi:hypothetical protein